MSSPSPRPIALSDSELTTIMAACRPLNPADRESFLRAVATVLGGKSILGEVLGDGVVSRVCREIQSRYWQPPELDGRPHVTPGGKYGR
jgi:hypothetical protein